MKVDGLGGGTKNQGVMKRAAGEEGLRKKEVELLHVKGCRLRGGTLSLYPLPTLMQAPFHSKMIRAWHRFPAFCPSSSSRSMHVKFALNGQRQQKRHDYYNDDDDWRRRFADRKVLVSNPQKSELLFSISRIRAKSFGIRATRPPTPFTTDP